MVIVPLLIVALVVGIGIGRLQPWQQVAVPTPSASPQQVVRTYLEAQEAKDRGTLEEILLNDRDVPSWTDLLLRSGAGYRDVIIEEPRRDRSGEARTWRQGVYVPVEWTVTDGPKDGFSDGRQPWGYLLVRNSDDEPWRIVDQGVG